MENANLFLESGFENSKRIVGIMSIFVCAVLLSHYSRYNVTAEAAAATVTGIHSLAFLAEVRRGTRVSLCCTPLLDSLENPCACTFQSIKSREGVAAWLHGPARRGGGGLHLPRCGLRAL
jgi:hypothetical protein